MASEYEYGYGINPALVLTDKMPLLGHTAHPFMRYRYLQSTSAPAHQRGGLGKIQGNFEKFLIDDETGKPVRR
jgi:glutathione peroxidase-family protein